MEVFECEFCHKSFSTKASLGRHKKSAKVCIKKRGVVSDVSLPILAKYSCIFCEHSFTQNYNLNRHLLTCKVKKELEMSETKKDKRKIKKLEAELKEKDNVIKIKNECMIAYKEGVKDSKTKNVVNYRLTTNLQCVPIENIIPLTITRIQECLNYYTYERFDEGIDGVINFILHVVTGTGDPTALSYYCTEVPRRTFYRFDKNWIKDPNGTYLNNIFDLMRPAIKDYYKTFTKELNDDTERMLLLSPYKTGRTILDMKKEELYPIFTGICNFTIIERDKLLNKVREILTDKLRINDDFVIEYNQKLLEI